MNEPDYRQQQEQEEERLFCSQEYLDYIYKNRMICNGDMLVDAMEDTSLFDDFLKDR